MYCIRAPFAGGVCDFTGDTEVLGNGFCLVSETMLCNYCAWILAASIFLNYSSFNLHVVKVDILVTCLFADHRSSCLEEEDLNLFIDVDCMHTEAIMTPMPEGLSQQQVMGF